MTWDKGYLDGISREFDTGVEDLQQQVDDALSDLATSPSDPQKLALYQSKLSEYNLYRNAQSNTVKVFKDIDAAIIQNFR
ncbi:type III secretion system needle complex protein [Burkholderia ubonensis]|uniref:type III secretion system needle complex protein n=1 Tax=Burkholderia ubonensis TaxID=101571 RepID=UPI00075CCE19|nr:type III secretion system needle complex protein [Burkholderia ubonensis]KVT58149.1 type III secretion system protein PrgI [Burkholderia ubonensis]